MKGHKDEYRIWCRAAAGLPIFMKDWWLDAKQVTLSIQSVDGVAAIVRPVGMKDGDYCYTFSLN